MRRQFADLVKVSEEERVGLEVEIVCGEAGGKWNRLDLSHDVNPAHSRIADPVELPAHQR